MEKLLSIHVQLMIKRVEDLLRSTHLPNNTEICFIDDLYHPQMDT